MNHARGKASDGSRKIAIRLIMALGAVCLMASASITFVAEATPEASADGGPDMTAALPEPRLECVTQIDAARFDALLGYDLDAGSVVTIPAGPHNGFSPGQAARGQPEFFRPGSHPEAFAIRFDGSELVWSLAGQTVTVSSASPRCASCTSPCPEGAACEAGVCMPVCGDGVCAGDESCTNCPGDCQCASEQRCLRIAAQTVTGLEAERAVELTPRAACCTPTQCGVGWECGSGDSCGAPLDCGQCDPGNVCIDHVCVSGDLDLLLAPPDLPALESSISRVTGLDAATRTGREAETVIDISRGTLIDRIFGSEVLNVAYNDGSLAPEITFPAGTRRVCPGASLMGWSNTVVNPFLFPPVFGFRPPWVHHKLQPPFALGVAVLWGDPAIASAPTGTPVLLISNLAVPTGKLPDTADRCFLGGLADDPAKGPGGACIALSTDGGRSATVVQCLIDRTPVAEKVGSGLGHFYDGSSLAIGPGGAAYAAFNDVERRDIAVWKSADIHNFAANPFVLQSNLLGTFGSGSVFAHPRLRVAPDDALRIVTLQGSVLVVNIFGRPEPPVVLARDVVLQGQFLELANRRTIRFGPQYSFDLGMNEAGERELRFIYQYRGGDGHFHVRGGRCAPDLSRCQPQANWDSLRAGGQGSDQFHPNIRFSPRTGVWGVTYQSTQGGNGSQVAIWAGSFAAARTFVPEQVTALQEPCPDGRGYWGDYDDMAPDLLTGTFWRPYSDSSHGVCSMDTFTANPVDVSAVRFSAPPAGPPSFCAPCLSSADPLGPCCRCSPGQQPAFPGSRICRGGLISPSSP
jgi:hypothetical protein